MWKLYISIVGILIFNKSSFAQTDDIDFGVKTGLNLATTKFPAPTNPINRIASFNAGFFVQVTLDKKFSIRPEFLFSVKGYGYSELSNKYQRKVRFNYLVLPLLVGYRINKKITVFAGPEFGYLMDATVTYDNIPNRTNVTKFYREVDFAFDVGAAGFVTKTIGIELRYSNGFKDLQKVTKFDDFGRPIGKEVIGSHRVFTMGVFYQF
jgi:hypothetical protein